MSLTVSNRTPMRALQAPPRQPAPAPGATVQTKTAKAPSGDQVPRAPMSIGTKLMIGGGIGGAVSLAGACALGLLVSPVVGFVLGGLGLFAAGAAFFYGVLANNLTT